MSDRKRIDDLLTQGIDRVESKVGKLEDKVENLTVNIQRIQSTVQSQSNTLNDHIAVVAAKEARIAQELTRSNDILRENTDSLKEHIRRTELLENKLSSIDGRLCPIEQEFLRSQIIKNYIKDKWKRWAIILGIIGTSIGIIARFTDLLKF